MATASAVRADKGASLRSRAFRAPLQRGRLAVGRQRFGRGKGGSDSDLPVDPKGAASMRPDEEIEVLRASAHCAALLEHSTPPWGLDRRESTKNWFKYRRGKGEILIVNHGAAAGGVRRATRRGTSSISRSISISA